MLGGLWAAPWQNVFLQQVQMFRMLRDDRDEGASQIQTTGRRRAHARRPCFVLRRAAHKLCQKISWSPRTCHFAGRRQTPIWPAKSRRQVVAVPTPGGRASCCEERLTSSAKRSVGRLGRAISKGGGKLVSLVLNDLDAQQNPRWAANLARAARIPDGTG